MNRRTVPMIVSRKLDPCKGVDVGPLLAAMYQALFAHVFSEGMRTDLAPLLKKLMSSGKLQRKVLRCSYIKYTLFNEKTSSGNPELSLEVLKEHRENQEDP